MLLFLHLGPENKELIGLLLVEDTFIDFLMAFNLTAFEESFTPKERVELTGFLFSGRLLEHWMSTEMTHYKVRYIFHATQNSRTPIENFRHRKKLLGEKLNSKNSLSLLP